MLHDALLEFGLSEKEAKVYIALLELELATVNHISKHTGINRSSTYVVMESLKKHGLVNTTEDKKVRQYIATSPEVFIRLAENSARKQSELKEKMYAVVPELKALYKGTKRKPLVRVFEGKQGLINAFEDTLKMREKKIRISSSAKNLIKILPKYFPKYMKLRIEKGIKMFGIHPASKFDKMVVKTPSFKFDNNILIPEKQYPFPADLAIYDDKIAYMSLENKGIAIVIESKEMADVMKSVFDLAFKEAKRLSKKKR